MPPPVGRLAAALLGALLLTLGAAACGSDTATQDTSQDPVTEDAGPPATEDTAAQESADDSDNQAVAVELPGLPIGGSSIVVSDTLQCVDVGWTTPPDLPDWAAVTVTGVAFQPSDGFALSSEPCGGDTPSCFAQGVRISGSERCYVAVTWTGPTLDSDRAMSFTSGEITCRADQVQACESFRDQVAAAGPQSVGLEPAPAELGEGSGGDQGATSDGGG